MRLRELRARRAVLQHAAAAARQRLARDAADMGVAAAAATLGVAAARLIALRLPLRWIVGAAAALAALVRAITA